MGLLVNQLQPAELARLKAELAETLIANFCYPRFFDYCSNTLRMRPVDRMKRQEVWQYLGSVDFNAWGRIDVMSPELQRQVERLFIHFVQRNRAFFGEQGRKRMADIRMLIDTASSSVMEGLRRYLTGRQTTGATFGSPRPVTSWSTPNIAGRPEVGWDQILATTLLLQQQLQEVRGEIKAAATSDAQPNGIATRRPMRGRPTVNGNSTFEPGVMPDQHVAMNKSVPREEVLTTPPLQNARITNTSTSAGASIPAPVAPSMHKVERIAVSEDVVTPSLPAPSKPAESATVTQVRSPEPVQRLAAPSSKIQPRDLPQAAKAPLMEVLPKEPGGTAVLVGDEDVMIFEQLRHQLVMWLRVEAVRSGLDMSGQNASQLLELLRRQDGFDETQLQVVSTLLNLSDKVIATGHADLFEYKQAMMFYLMHTRRSK